MDSGKGNLLVVDGDYSVRSSITEGLARHGYSVVGAASGEEGLNRLRSEDFDLVLLDLQLPDVNGIELLSRIRRDWDDVVVIMVSAVGRVETAVEAMQRGAFHYITKPCRPDELAILVQKGLHAAVMDRRMAGFRLMQRQRFGVANIIAESPPMKEVLALVGKMAGREGSTVLIQGESGTGKELVAKAIHYESPRADQPFLAVNCAAVPTHLLESELMGYEKGAFTDARNRKKGLLEMADGGTLFLDEIGEMDILMQAKLLRVLEDKGVRRIGGTAMIPVDVRIVSATNQDLLEGIRENRFRQDLYYRLHVLPIYVPPLRRRKEDILPLTAHFIGHFNRELGREVEGVSRMAEKFLLEYDWPGNVRELRNVIERAMILEGTSQILLEHLPREIIERTGGAKSGTLNFQLPPDGVDIEEVERELIRQSLELAKGNQSHAARKLNLGIDAFRYRMKKFGFL
ncbi:MAG: sigma-54-dependent Fis family transcriptional regulator [Desulfuromonadaceae bacterium]|nr:sigma-54-dependent Fis family transcriptional regulator [Desulfuromonadaceae bacterium]